MRADRLLRLLHLLQRHGTLPAARLATMLEVSERTVLRDMDALSAAGVPVFAQRGRGGGCGLVEGYRTDVSGLTTGEAQALFLWGSRDATAELGLGPELGNALAKLAATVPTGAMDQADALASVLVVDRRRWFAAVDDVPVLPLLREASASGRRVRMRYAGAGDADPTTRTVDPYGLVENAGRWYFLAAHRGRRRTYRVSRVVDAVVLDEPAQRPAHLDLAREWEDTRRVLEVGEQVTLDVAVAPAALAIFRRLAASQATAGTTVETLDVPADDDRPRLRLTVRARRQALGLVLTFGGDVEVLSPADLRADLLGAARAVIERHAGEPARP
ncbi:helix-turn-helix transcriptional regulator [Nocardioides litoris]|uniref:helix-turn-helix transcriptional regulator n=1 Tax=Nocardioides litoris TaxID=1926648 RepID=UPI001124B0D7|nr:WYL domain-containing protein [Nocardioides litoris]